MLRHGMLEIIVVRPVVYCVPLALCALARPVTRLLHTLHISVCSCACTPRCMNTLWAALAH